MNTLTKVLLLFFIVLSLVLSLSSCKIMDALFRADTSIYVAIVGPDSDKNDSIAKSFYRGAQLYFDEINQDGGIRGIKLYADGPYNDSNSPTIAQQRAYEIAEANRHIAVIGHHKSECTITAGEIYAQHRIPAITPASTAMEVTLNNDWYFRMVFNNNQQASFLAAFASEEFPGKAVSIIVEEDSIYGKQLFDGFTAAVKDYSIPIAHVWRFSRNTTDQDRKLSVSLEEKLQAITAEMVANSESLGVLFFATHSSSGAKLVKMIRDVGLNHNIISPGSFASLDFIKKFEQLQADDNLSGFYTNNIHVATPLLIDTIGEVGQQFRNRYRDRYGEKPCWRAAYAYDAARVIAEAARHELVISGRQASLSRDRNLLFQFLNNQLIQPDTAFEGVTGPVYFDDNGDVPRPVLIGVYHNNNLVSSMFQFQALDYLQTVEGINTKKPHNRHRQITWVNGRKMAQTNIVYTGLEFMRITDIDLNRLTCVLDFNIWFRYRKDFDIENVQFVNALEQLDFSKENLVESLEVDNMKYARYHFTGKFKLDSFGHRYAFGRHDVGISLVHNKLPKSDLVFVTDMHAMGERAMKSYRRHLEKSQILEPDTGWQPMTPIFFQDTLEKHLMGKQPIFNSVIDVEKFSQFNAKLPVNKIQFSLRGVVPGRYDGYLLIAAMVLLAGVYWYDRSGLRRKTSKVYWGLQALSGVLTLMMFEMVICRFAVLHLEWKYFELIRETFDLLWWFIPAVLLAMALEPFVWSPRSERYQRIIPDVLRNFFIFIIFSFMIVGVLVFEFNQNVTKLMATSGLITLIIGFAIQDNISNFFSGIVVNQGNTLRIGDWVRIGEEDEGKVVDITWRETKIRTRSDNILNLPNKMVSESAILNFSILKSHIWQNIKIQLGSELEPAEAEKLLRDAVIATAGVLSDPSPRVFFDGFKGATAEYQVEYCINDYDNKSQYERAVWENIWLNLDESKQMQL